MTDLTELWKKGELSSGWYYVRLIRGEHRIDLYINGKNEWVDCPDNIIDAVVCDVPSYELWKAVHEQWKALIEENAKLKEEVSRESYKVSEAYCLVEELKNLLKECHSFIEDYDNKKLLTKIDEVLK